MNNQHVISLITSLDFEEKIMASLQGEKSSIKSGIENGAAWASGEADREKRLEYLDYAISDTHDVIFILKKRIKNFTTDL